MNLDLCTPDCGRLRGTRSLLSSGLALGSDSENLGGGVSDRERIAKPSGCPNGSTLISDVLL